MSRKRFRDQDRGAALVEAALVLMLLFLCIFTIAEFGLAFKDWLTVNHGAREGARAGATFGNRPDSDYLILAEMGRQLGAAGIIPDTVRIFNVNNPSEGTNYQYMPGNGQVWDSSWQGTLPTYCDWSPCPHPASLDAYQTPQWDPITRDITAPDTDIIGVRAEYAHRWITPFYKGGVSNFGSTVEMQIEPQIFESS